MKTAGLAGMDADHQCNDPAGHPEYDKSENCCLDGCYPVIPYASGYGAAVPGLNNMKGHKVKIMIRDFLWVSFAALIVSASSLLTGCQSTVRYGDATSVQSLTADFSATDLQMISSKMVDSMLSFPPIVELTSQRRPIIVVGAIKNRTTRWVDGKAITDTITAKLTQSGKFRFVDRSTDREVISELKSQQEGGLTDPSKATPFGRQEAAEFIITGDFIDISQRANGKQDVYYKFTLSLRNLRTGIVEWKDEKEIRKLVE